MDSESLDVLTVLTKRLAHIHATQEIILKCEAHYFAHKAQVPWEPIFEDLRAQAKEAAAEYHQQVVAELKHLRDIRLSKN